MRIPARTVVARTGAVVAGALCLLLLPATGAADPAEGLPAKAASLAARERAALLELYALDSRLEQARDELTELQVRIAALERERASARQHLRTARRTLAVAERHLGEQLRLLYEQEQPDFLAVLFGATSLDEVITGLDALSRAARTTNRVIEQARTARDRVARLGRSLAERGETLGRLRAAASERESSLAEARAGREAYIARLRAERRLTQRQIAGIEEQARAARARAAVETVRAETAGSVASFGAQVPAVTVPARDEPEAPARTTETPPETQPAEQASAPRAGRTLTVLSTGYALTGTTATGLPVGAGIVAVDPTVIPLGTRMTIPGYGEGVAADTGPAIKGLRIDIWFPTRKQALAWGWRTVTVVLH